MAKLKENVQSKQTQEDYSLLKDVLDMTHSIKLMTDTLNELKKDRDTKLKIAVEKGLERVGNLKLITKTKVNRTIDLAALSTVLSPEEIASISSVTIKDAKRLLTDDLLDKCTTKQVIYYHEVIDALPPNWIEKI